MGPSLTWGQHKEMINPTKWPDYYCPRFDSGVDRELPRLNLVGCKNILWSTASMI